MDTQSGTNNQIQPEAQIPSPTKEISIAVLDLFKKHIFKIIGAFLLFLAIILGGVMYMSGGNFTQSGVVVALDGDSDIEAGVVRNFSVKYYNNTQQQITNATLSIFLPTDVYIVATDSYEESSVIKIPLGSIDAGYSSQYDMKLVFAGQVDSLKSIKAILEYSPIGFDTKLTNEAQLNGRIVSAPLSVEVNRPQNISPNQKIKYTIKYKNNTDDVLEGLRLNIKLPEDFMIQISEPQLSGGKYLNIDRILPDEEFVLDIAGQIRGSTGQAKKIRIGVETALVLGSDSSYREINYKEDEFVIAKPPLDFVASVNGSTGYFAGLGDSLNYEIRIRNDTQNTFNNLDLSVDLIGSMFDLSNINAEGQIRSGGRNIFYDVTNNPALGIFRSGDIIVIKFSAKAKNSLPLFGKTSDDDLLIRVKLNSPSVPEGLPADLLPFETEYRTKLSVNSSFTSKVFRNYDNFVASGEFPPKAEKESQFVLSMKALSQSSSLRNIVMTAKLAPGVKWLDRTRVIAPTINPISYDSRLNILTWRIGDVPMGSGGSDIGKNVEGIFMLSVIPNANQIGQPVNLLTDILFDGVDTTKNQTYRYTIRNITTNRVEGETLPGEVVE